MRRNLAIAGVAGLGVGAVLLTMAFGIGGNMLSHVMFNFGDFDMADCPVDAPPATATRRLLDWSGGDELVLRLPANIHYRAGSGEQVVVSGAPDMVAHVRVKDGEIGMDCNPRRNWKRADGIPLNVTLPGRVFRKIESRGVGDLDLAGIDQRELRISVRGLGDVKAQGRVESLGVEIRGLGDMDLSGLAARDGDISIRGAGNVQVDAEQSLKIEIRGSGDVHLVREPKNLETNIRGSGHIFHPDGSSFRTRGDRDDS